MFQDRLVAWLLYAQTYRIFGSRPDALDCRGSVYGSDFSYQFAFRATALSQMLACTWLLPEVSRESNVVAGTLAPSVNVSANGEKASKFRLRMVGTAPAVGELRSVLPSDCLEWSRRDNASDVRVEVDVDDRESVYAEFD